MERGDEFVPSSRNLDMHGSATAEDVAIALAGKLVDFRTEIKSQSRDALFRLLNAHFHDLRYVLGVHASGIAGNRKNDHRQTESHSNPPRKRFF